MLGLSALIPEKLGKGRFSLKQYSLLVADVTASPSMARESFGTQRVPMGATDTIVKIAKRMIVPNCKRPDAALPPGGLSLINDREFLRSNSHGLKG
jgi:hypothetical protein